MTISDAATTSGLARTTLGKIETAETRRVSQRQVDALIQAYKIGNTEAEALRQLARDAGEKGWWWRYRDVFGHDSLPDFEAEASQIHTYEVAGVPGLLQIPEYAEAIFKGGPTTTDDHIRRQVDARMKRRDVLHRHEDPPHLWAIIDEAALRRPIGGPETMRAQLSYLLRVGQHPNIDIQVLPYAVGAHIALGMPFTLLEFPERADPTIVYTDSIVSGHLEEDPEAIREYSRAFAHLQATAPSTVESERLIEAIREES